MVGERMFIAPSGPKTNLHPVLQKALDDVPIENRAPWHGNCGEIGCIDLALKAGINPGGGVARAVNIGKSGGGHGTPKPACTSCQEVGKRLNVDTE